MEKMEEQNNKLDKVIKGQAIVHKKTFGEKIKEAFISVDFKEAVAKGTKDVIIPMIKRTIADTINNTINTMLFGSSAAGHNWVGSNSIWSNGVSRFGYSGQNIDYSGISSNKPVVPTTNNLPTYNEIILQDRGDAEMVLDTLQSQLDRYKSVSISNLYEAVGLPTVSTYYNYGWKNLASADVVAVSNGYLLKLPRAIPLN